jgi:predicted O-methyltransferase YrrM
MRKIIIEGQEIRMSDPNVENVPTAEQYVESLYAADPVLKRVEQSIRENGMPEISIHPGYGRLLTLLVRLSGAKHVLEIGALGGYSGICLARGLGSDGTLTSLELEQKYADLAHSNLRTAGLGDKVEYIVGEALDGLKKVADQGRRFDFFFIDADKGNYPNYLDGAIKLGNPGAIILGDNALMHGRSANPHITAPSVEAMREFNKRIAADPRLESTLLPAYDGLVVARIR